MTVTRHLERGRGRDQFRPQFHHHRPLPMLWLHHLLVFPHHLPAAAWRVTGRVSIHGAKIGLGTVVLAVTRSQRRAWLHQQL